MEHSSNPLQVLVVDDEPLLRWSVVQALTMLEDAVVAAADGRGALAAVADAASPFDVILLDYRLPDSDDLVLLATIRRVAPTSAVILMTAYGTPEVLQGARALGVRGVLEKPFGFEEMTALVRHATESVATAAQ
jgi:DNA-binding NtrC family response regulator